MGLSDEFAPFHGVKVYGTKKHEERITRRLVPPVDNEDLCRVRFLPA